MVQPRLQSMQFASPLTSVPYTDKCTKVLKCLLTQGLSKSTNYSSQSWAVHSFNIYWAPTMFLRVYGDGVPLPSSSTCSLKMKPKKWRRTKSSQESDSNWNPDCLIWALNQPYLNADLTLGSQFLEPINSLNSLDQSELGLCYLKLNLDYESRYGWTYT